MWRSLCFLGLVLPALVGCDHGTIGSTPKNCPSGTTPWSNAHCYEAILAPGFSWSDSQNSCAARGGHLVTITSAKENAFVFGLVSGINAFWYLDGFGNGLGPWLGGYQQASPTAPNAGWQWVTGEPFVDVNWEIGQPGDFGTVEQDRLRFFKAGGLIGDHWDDSESNNPLQHRLGYICEYE